MRDLTQLLNGWSGGDAAALEQLTPLVEAELRRVARAHLRKESPGHTLQPTALINEAYLRLIEWKNVAWQGRAHFFAVSSKLMRRILVNHSEARGAQKRGGAAIQVTLLDDVRAAEPRDIDIVALDIALNRLFLFDPKKSELVELRFFGGLSAEEAAEVMGMSLRTANREWSLARAWLFRELQSTERPPG
jgi:RNA polymerase sigma-70 factor (ECF subfamily)